MVIGKHLKKEFQEVLKQFILMEKKLKLKKQLKNSYQKKKKQDMRIMEFPIK